MLNHQQIQKQQQKIQMVPIIIRICHRFRTKYGIYREYRSMVLIEQIYYIDKIYIGIFLLDQEVYLIIYTIHYTGRFFKLGYQLETYWKFSSFLNELEKN